MSARTAVSWQTSLADLSLILFMITAAAVTHRPPARHRPDRPPAAVARPPAGPSDRGEALAVYIAGPGAPPLARWLSQQPRDPRQQLTITVAYAPGAEARALETAAAMLRQAQAGASDFGGARIVVEPGAGPPQAALAFDAPAIPPLPPAPSPSVEGMARSLRPSGQASSHGPVPQ
ncbi:hypothetical protein WBP06_14030 [Novosphingobium sp. BL-8H]|uniref:hypothetical protein n=1 Tax=Novosphingobium sp. BL-8H TaxID=3127640 RepID=UPI0037574EB7